MSWIVNIAGKAEDFLNKIDQTTAVALNSGDQVTPNSSFSKAQSKRSRKRGSEQPYETSAPLPTPISVVTLPSLTNNSHLSTDVDFLKSVSVDGPIKQSVESEVSEARNGLDRLSSRPKPPRPSKMRNLPNSSFKSSGLASSSSSSEAIATNGALNVKNSETNKASSKSDEQLLEFLNSPSQVVDESCLLKNEIASQSREMSLLLRNYKQLQQEHETLKKSYEVSVNQLKKSIDDDDRKNISIPVITTTSSQSTDFAEEQLAEKQLEIENLREQLKSAFEKLENAEESQSIKNRIEQLELEKQRLASEHEDVATKLKATNEKLNVAEKQIGVTKEKLIALEIEYSNYKDKAKSILQSKDELIANMSSNSNNHQDEHTQQSTPSNGSDVSKNSPKQFPNELQFLSEIGSLRSERELLHAEITQNRFYSDSLREENNRLETELSSLRSANASLHSSISKEKQSRHNYQEENLRLSQQISTLQLDFERARLDKLKVQEKLDKYELGALGSNMRKSNSLNDFDVSLQKHGLTGDEETDTLRTRITALSQSLLEKQNYINSLSADKQLLQLRIERLQAKAQEMNQEVEYHQGDSFDDEGLTNHSVVSSQPLYLSESPWDSRIARRVKRAYTRVDSFCCQIGLILRQRPNIRLGFCVYIIFLHLWVFFVLFSWSHNHTSPEAAK